MDAQHENTSEVPEREANGQNGLARIRAYYTTLSPAERKVADFILKQGEAAARLTLSEVATGSGVSEATAVRFCRSIGYQKILELKLALTRSIPNSLRLIYDEVEVADTPLTVAHKVFQGSLQALQDTIVVLEASALERALDLLDRANHILIVGVGTSAPMAHELNNRLFRLRLNCQVETDSYLQVMRAALLASNDLLVVISQSGSSNDPVRTASEARARGCPILCITGNSLSPLAELADVVLLSVSHETRPETLSSRVAQHVLIQALYVALALRHVDEANAAESAIWDALLGSPPFQVQSHSV